MKRIAIWAIFAMISMGCNDIYDATLLEGEWEVAEWTRETTGENIERQMDFDFGTDGFYALDYGNKIEKGKYWISGTYLHTIADGASEIKVKVNKLTKDSLVMEMNRSGNIEKVILLKD